MGAPNSRHCSSLQQSTLELESIIELFVADISKEFRHDGIEYISPDQELTLTLGVNTTHSTSYELKVLEQPLGVLRFCRNHPFDDDELKLLEHYLTILLYPLRNALLYRSAINSAFIDALTGVKNRAAFVSNFNRELDLASRNGTELSIIMLDVDYFKRINDKYGHTVGDMVLKNIALAVEASVRSSDALYRYGGEEFVITLSGTCAEGAYQLAERIRKNVEALSFSSPKGLQARLSLGVATLQKNESGETLFKRADAALYCAKGQGRNQTYRAE